MGKVVDEKTYRTRFGHHAAAGFVSSIVIRIVALIFVKILTISLSKFEYGKYAFWIALVLLLATVSTSPFSETLWRHLQQKNLKTPKEASRLVSLSFVGSFIIIAAIFGWFLFSYILFGIRIVDDQFYLTILLVTAGLSVFYALKELILVISGSEQNSREILTLNLTFSFTSVAISSLMAILFQNFVLVLVGLCIGYSLPIFISLSRKLEQYRLSRFDSQDIRLVIDYGGPMVIVNSSGAATTVINSLAISMWIGLASVGTYNIAQVIAVLPAFVIAPALMAYYTYMVMTFETSNFEKGNQITTKIVELFVSVVTPLVYLIIAFSHLIIEIISTSEYLDALILVPFTVIAAAIITLSQFWKIRIQLVNKTHLAAGVYLLSIIVLIASLLIFQNLGLIGIGVAIFLQALTVLVGMYTVGNRNMPITLKPLYFVSWIVSITILFLVDIFLQQLGFSPMLASVLASVVYFICLVLTRGLKLHEVSYIIKIMLGKS